MQPIAITGYGLTTALGRGVAANWELLRGGASGLRPISSFDASKHLVPSGGEAPPLEGAGPDDDRRERAHRYLLEVCREALAMAGLERAPDPERTALVVGSSLAAQASAPRFWRSYFARGAAEADYAALRSYDVELRLADLCERLEVGGEALLVSNACAAGATAVAVGADLLRLGRADLVIACGYDALDVHTLSGFAAIKALAPEVRPFGRERGGMQLGDGFAALLLEPEAPARAAGRPALGRLLGYGESADAHHLTQPDPEGGGAALAMERALALAGADPALVDTINVHGTATPSNDLAEARAMRRVLGERLAAVPLTASKPAVGHALGGSGAVEAVIALHALREGVLPPVPGAWERDPECGPLDLVGAPRATAARTALSNSFGFGGCNASLLLARADEERP